MLPIISIQSLQFTLEQISINDLTATHVTLNIRFNVTNPTAMSAIIPDASFKLYLNQTYVGSSVLPSMNIMAGSSRTISCQLPIAFANLPSIIKTLITSHGHTTATIEGVAHTNFGDYPFKIEREIDLYED
jgi:LEA14-like dessication related protein